MGIKADPGVVEVASHLLVQNVVDVVILRLPGVDLFMMDDLAFVIV